MWEEVGILSPSLSVECSNVERAGDGSEKGERIAGAKPLREGGRHGIPRSSEGLGAVKSMYAEGWGRMPGQNQVDWVWEALRSPT